MSESSKYRDVLYGAYASHKAMAAPTAGDYQRWEVELDRRIGRWLPDGGGAAILELGCGAGAFLSLANRRGHTDVTGLDLSPEQVRLAQARCPGATVLQQSLHAFLSGASQRFDLIVALDVFEHLSKDELLEALSLSARALKPGGRLVVQMPNGDSPWLGPVAFGDLTHEVMVTPALLGRLLTGYGFTGFQAAECGPVVHGVRSAVRFALWRAIRVGLRLWNMSETSEPGSGIYTRVFTATAVRPGV